MSETVRQQKEGSGIDRTVMHQLLALSIPERLHLLVREARMIARFDERVRRR